MMDKSFPKIRISDDDILKAMKDISGYIDITPEDFKELYKHASEHALKRLLTSISARDIMTKDVITVKKGKTLRDVAALLAKMRITGLPVVDEDNVVTGIISEKDILKRMGFDTFMDLVASYLKMGETSIPSIGDTTVEEIMSTPPVTVFEDTTVMEIMRLFIEKNINRLPVVNKDMKIRGIVTRHDLLKIWEINK